MRRFHSYGPLDIEEHYYAPRKELIKRAYTQLTGEHPKKGGHYITVWAPRQTGKTWIMQQILHQLQKDSHFDVLKINLQHLKDQENIDRIIMSIAEAIGEKLGKAFTGINTGQKFQDIFKKDVLDKPTSQKTYLLSRFIPFSFKSAILRDYIWHLATGAKCNQM